MQAHDAFISYSHAADNRLAPALQQALHGFAKPWWRRRAVSVFRDETNLSANPDFLASILKMLEASHYFILLASPEAAASKWVQREVAHWVETKEASRLLIVLTDGEVVWDDGAKDFDWTATTALPEGLKGTFDSEPFYIDLRWTKGSEGIDTLSGWSRLAGVATVAE